MVTNDAPQKSLKSVFVISPIGKLDKDGFDFTHLFLHEIVKPAAEAAGGFAVPVRADEVSAPGSITAKVVRDIVNADVCVADLTGRNPNVMYEVAIAHAADKPVILLQQEPGGPPFDFTDERVISYSTRADEANTAKRRLTEHLKNAHHEAEDDQLKQTMHPVRTIFRDLQTRASASEPEQAILERLDSVTQAVKTLEGVVLERSEAAPVSRNLPRGPGNATKSYPVRYQKRSHELARAIFNHEAYVHLLDHLAEEQKFAAFELLQLALLRVLAESSGELSLDDPEIVKTVKMVLNELALYQNRDLKHF